MAAAMSVTAWAGEWKQDEGQWCYQNDDGTYAEMGWHWINGKCYHFPATVNLIIPFVI